LIVIRLQYPHINFTHSKQDSRYAIDNQALQMPCH